MHIKPVAKFTKSNQLIFECPQPDCDWAFTTAVGEVGANIETQKAVYKEHLENEFREHLKEKHSGNSTNGKR